MFCLQYLYKPQTNQLKQPEAKEDANESKSEGCMVEMKGTKTLLVYINKITKRLPFDKVFNLSVRLRLTKSANLNLYFMFYPFLEDYYRICPFWKVTTKLTPNIQSSV